MSGAASPPEPDVTADGEDTDDYPAALYDSEDDLHDTILPAGFLPRRGHVLADRGRGGEPDRQTDRTRRLFPPALLPPPS